MSLEHAQEVIAEKLEDYHSIRPHSSQGTLTPDEFLVQQTEFRQNTIRANLPGIADSSVDEPARFADDCRIGSGSADDIPFIRIRNRILCIKKVIHANIQTV